MKYSDYTRNHIIRPGSEEELATFLGSSYKGMQHKRKNGVSSNSEDALTWSCFDLIRTMPQPVKVRTLNEVMEDSYSGDKQSLFTESDQIEIHVGKRYTGPNTGDDTEVDASVELSDKLIFFEAKLYSSVSMSSEDRKYDQIALKLRVGLDCAMKSNKDFYFIFLDIAPREKLNRRKSKEEALSSSKGGFDDKWKSAWLFNYYKDGRNGSNKPLKEALKDLPLSEKQITLTANNMGWLTWADLFKSVLRGEVMK